ncbi:MAG: hypothetical protein R3C03_17860 [Pirellulaceae bacterium]
MLPFYPSPKEAIMKAQFFFGIVCIIICMIASGINELKADTVSLDFEVLFHTDSNAKHIHDIPGQNDPFVYTEDGYTLTRGAGAGNFMSVSVNCIEFLGSTSLLNDGLNTTTTLTRNNNSLFDIDSITLGFFAGPSGYPQNVPVTFTGFFQNGQTVQQTLSFTINNSSERYLPQTFTFDPNFRNLQSIVWRQNSGNPATYQFDNITLTSVPEPDPNWFIATFGIVTVVTNIRRQVNRMKDSLNHLEKLAITASRA